jgi:hypothetical protein
VGQILCIQARGKKWKIRINRAVTCHDKRMWVRVKGKGKNKEKCIDGVTFLTGKAAAYQAIL